MTTPTEAVRAAREPVRLFIKKRTRQPRRVPIWLRKAEIDELLAAVPGRRDRLIVLVGIYAGLRVSEICKLRVEDLDFEDALIEVRHGKGDRDRTLPMHRRLGWELRTFVDGRRSGWVFPSERSQSGHLERRRVQVMIAQARERAQIVRHVTPHKLRHTFATNLLASGSDLLEIRDLLGHSSVATTQIYAHTQPERLRGSVERLDDVA